MRKVFFLFFFISTYVLSQSSIFVKYSDDISLENIERLKQTQIKSTVNTNKPVKPLLAESYKVSNSNVYSERIVRIVKYTFSTEEQKEQFIAGLDRSNVEYLQDNIVYKINFTPNDSLLSEQWALKNINAFDAWNITKGSPDIKIGVIDTGIDYLHPDIENTIYINPGEDLNGNGKYDISDENGIDDDGNGFIDDIMGWDFTDRYGFPFDTTGGGGDYLDWDNDPLDEQGHGTAISGIIGATQNNISGISGVAPNCKIVNLRAFDPSGYGDEDDVSSAILYAVDNGVDVLNMSFGDGSFSYVLKDVVEYAYSQGLTMVGSSGNSGSSKPHYPSGYPEVISVGMSSESDYVSGLSNFGSTIDLVAPGVSILSTDYQGGYDEVSGTSAATPFVSATAALLLSIDDFTNQGIKQILKSTADDIAEDGWDSLAGAGRLNVYKALQVSAPGNVAFISPEMDYSSSSGEIVVAANLISPYFESYKLKLGKGYLPDTFEDIISDGRYQLSNDTIHIFNVNELADTVYTLALEVSYTDGGSSEERVNFHVDRTAPEPVLINSGAAYYGETPTIIASFQTDEVAVAQMYFRKKGAPEFQYITLDGLTVNNQFVKQLHYGFVPSGLIDYNTEYEVYFKIKNLAGLETEVLNDGEYFLYLTGSAIGSRAYTVKEFEHTNGRLFKETSNFTGVNNFLINEAPSSENLHIYSLTNNEFVLVDSISERIPLTVGDFNNDGKKDILSTFLRNAYIETQNNPNQPGFSNVFKEESGDLWPVLADDIDGDNLTEIIFIYDSETINIFEVGSDFSVTPEYTLENFSELGIIGNTFNTNRGVICDSDNNGLKEFWIGDDDGDVIGFECDGVDSYQNKASISSGLAGYDFRIGAGDYDGDGVEDVAVLFKSYQELHIAPFYTYYIFNTANNSLNILDTKTLFDPSTEFSSSIFHTAGDDIKLADIDNDGRSEMILFTFPYVYISEYENGVPSITYFTDNVNSDYIFTGDLDNNGVAELALPNDYGVSFIEFSKTNSTPVPAAFKGYSLANSIKLSWVSEADKYYIFKGSNKDQLTLIDSSNNPEYIDTDITLDQNYYYSVQAYSSNYDITLSNISNSIKVYAHTPAIPTEVKVKSSANIVVKFSEKINKTILNLESFSIEGIGRANSISPSTENSYLLTFRPDLEPGEYSLVIKDILDYYGSPIDETKIDFTVESIYEDKLFIVNSYKVTSKYSIVIEFSDELDEASALNRTNYNIKPSNSVKRVSLFGENNNQVLLETNNPISSIGREVVIQLSDIYSSSQSGSIKISEGSGSYIVLSGYGDNLDDFMIYPNPFKESFSVNKITFANITKKAKITIFNLSGIKMAELEEIDGNGGIEWDLRDTAGNKLSSGIYICYIQAYDKAGNETETKIEKFAIIR